MGETSVYASSQQEQWHVRVLFGDSKIIDLNLENAASKCITIQK